jgi:hypothetical protein
MKSSRSGWRRTRRFLVSDKTLFRPISTDLRPAFFAHHQCTSGARAALKWVAGGIVGEMAIVEDALPRSAMVYALGRSEVVKINERRFFAMVANTPAFARTVMRVLSRRLRRMDRLYRPDRTTEHVVHI